MASTPSSANDVDVAHPWPGLASFTEKERRYFHGRTQEIDALFRHTRRRLLTVLFGQSGLGKSSLLQAGLFPRLRHEGFLPLYLRLDHAPTAPEHDAQIKAGLVRALTDAGVSTLPTSEESLWQFFHRRELVLRGRDGLPVTPVIVFDQFEEIFTLTHGDTATRLRTGRLLTDLADLVENRVPATLEKEFDDAPELSERYGFQQEDYRVILSLREDYLPHLENLRSALPSLTQNRMRINRMNGAQALDAVLKPGGDLVLPPVAEAIVRFVSGAAPGESNVGVEDLEIEPSLLSLICHELNNQRLALGHDRITADLLAGNSAAILRDFYERCLVDQPAAVRFFIEDHLLTESGFRENVALERASKLLEKEGVPPGAIPRLVDRRLLHVEERLNLRRVELTHDVLAGVVRASRDSRRARDEKESADQRVLDAERRERDARRHLWRARRAMAITVLLLVAAVAGAALAMVGQGRAARAQRTAQSAETRAHADEEKFRRMAIQADYAFATNALDKDDAATGIAYLRRVLRTAPDERPAAALLWSILRDRNWCLPLLPPFTHKDGLNTAEYSPDGTEIVTASKDGTARLWDARTGAPIGEPLRHDKEVVKAIFRPDGKQVATGATDGTVRLWDARTGQPMAIPPRSSQAITDLAYSPDGRRLATASDDHAVGLWDTTTGRSVSAAWPLQHSASLSSVCFSPDGGHLVTATSEGVAYIHDAVSGEVIGQPMRHQAGDVYVAVSPDGKWVATGSFDYTARLWDAHTGQPVGGPFTHKLGVMGVAFSPDSRRLLTYSDDMTAVVWEIATGKPAGQVMHHANFIWHAAFSPDGQRVLTTCLDGTARLWEAGTGKPLSEPMRHQSGIIYGAFSPDGTRVVTASQDHTAQVWDARRGSRLTLVFRHDDNVRSAEFSPDGREVATSSNDHTARLWDAASGRSLAPPLEHGGDVSMVSFSPDGRQVLTAADDKTARLWSAASGQPIGGALTPGDDVRTARFSPDGGRVVTAAGEQARVWEIPAGKPIGEPMPHVNGVFSAVFSPDGRQVATASADGTARVWDASSGRPLIAPLKGDGMIVNVRYTADGKRVLTSCFDGNANVWDSHTGARLVGPLHHDNSVWNVAFSPDDARIVTTSFDHTARLWNALTGKPTAPALKHGAEVLYAMFSADSGQVVTASFDGTARLWDAGNGLPLAEPMTHADRVNSARFSADGYRVLTASRDHTARLWDVRTPTGQPPGWFLDLAEAVGGKHLDDDGASENVPAARVVSLRQLALAAGDGDFVRFGHWFFADRGTRAISPFLACTVPEFVAAQEETGVQAALKEASEVQPCDPLLLARLARVEPDADSARFDAQLAQDRAPGNAEVFMQTALALDHLGEAAPAARAIETAIRLQPARAEYQAAKADLLWRAGDHATALATLDKAIQNTPKNAVFLMDRGLKRALAGDGMAACADLDAALQTAPDAATIHDGYGWVLIHLGDFGRAADQFKAASRAGLSGLAACDWQAGLKDQAVEAYLACISDRPAFARATSLREQMTALGLTDQDFSLLEAVRAATLEKHPEFRQ